MTPLQRNTFIAGSLFVSELLLGVGIIGASGFLIALVILLSSDRNKKAIVAALKIATIYTMTGLLTIAFLVKSASAAQRNAEPVIAACKQFRDTHNRYPASLDELVPDFIPEIPDARHTLVAHHFLYDPSRPQLYFVAMFHGIYAYDFPQDQWVTNE